MKTIHTIKAFTLILLTALMSVSVTVWAEDVTPSVTLTTYYSAANGKTSNALRTALQGIIDNHTNIGYDNLKYLMKYSDTDEANGTDVIDIYSTCTFTAGATSLTWASSGSVGDGMNREHTVPQSWFGEATPMVGDAFHIYPTDCKANNNRSSYLYGEFSGTGTSYSSSSCSESGKKSGSGTKTIASYSYGGTTYSPTATYSGIVYEPADEFKGDIARGYFYMATRYASGTGTANCSNWSGGAFGSDNNGFTNYTAELMLKWHRMDPVSRKELIRNEVIYGNTKYNKGDKKQGNRNPFIDYPELVEYIWGNKKGTNVDISQLVSAYDEAGTGTPTTTYNVTLWRHGNTQVVTGLTGDYTLPTTGETDACTSWVFDGWSSIKVSSTTTKPTTYITQATSSTGTAYAVYKKETSSTGAPIRKATMGTTDDELTLTTTGVSGTSYSNWSGKTAGSDAVYAGNSAGGNSAIQLRSNNSNSGIVTTASGGKVAKVTVTWNSNTASGRTINIYGKNSAYTAASDLYNNSNQGSLLGTIVKGTSTELSVSGDYEYIGIRSNSGALYLDKITITWSTSGGGSTTTYTYDSDPSDCNCSGKLSTPAVTATPSDGTITLTWSDVTNATNGYTVTISKGTGYTTECGDVEVGDITHSGSTNTCVITGLVNGLSYTTSVVANATATTCDSDADEDTTTPVGCTAWDDPTFTYASYTLTAGGSATAAPTVGAGHGTRTFTSSDESVLTVASDGKVTPKSAGTATVTAHWAGADGYCPKDVTTSTFTVNGKVIVTFDKNDGSSTTTTQQVDYNTATALTANAFTRTGYTFQGWALTADGAKEYNDGASITITAATTLYAVWQVNSHNVSFSKPTGASNLTVNGVTTSPKSVNYGSTVTIVVTPAAHYSVGSVTADGGVAVSGSGNNWSFTMPDKDVAVTVTMNEDTKYTVNWYVSGTPTAEVNYAGEALEGITDPSIECNDKVFVGWTSHNNYNSDEAPDDLFTSLSGLVMPSNNSTNYYAVFARESAGEPVLTNNYKKITSTSEFSTGNYLIVANHSDTYKAMSTTWKDTYYLSYVTVTPSNDVISTTDGTIIWNIAVSNDQASIYNATSKYLYIEQSGSYYNIKLGDNTTANKFTYGVSSGNWLFTSVTYNTRVLEFYTTRDRWAYHTAADAPVYLYKQQSNSSTTYSDYSTSCTAPTEVTVIFNANGGTGTMSDQVVDYNTATALTANTFTRTGYSFAGWATTADGSKAYGNQESVTLTKNTTLYALWTKNSYNVSFTPTMTGQATVTVNGASTSPQSVEFEGAVSIAIDPNVAYTVSGVTATAGVTPTGSGNNWSFNMPASDVTITVTLTAKPTYTIRFLNNGNVVSSQTVIQGQMADKPSDPTPCDADYTFEGWWTAALAEDNEESHTWITDFTATQNQDYYAVFSYADGEGGGNGTPEKATSISVGDEVILVYETGSMELSSFTTSSTIYGIGSAYTTTPSGSYSFTVVAGNADGSFAFERGGNYWNWSSGNSLSTSSSVTNNSSWTVSFSNGNAIITNVSGTSRTIRWNASSPRFACYESGQSAVQLYKVGAGSTTYYTTAPVCAACENKITLTKGTPANGSFALDKDNGEYDNCKSKGFVVTVSDITPAEDYEFDAITQTGINSGVTIDQNAKTVTYAQNVSGSSTINVTFKHKPQYTIKFVDDGSVISEQLVTINKSAVKPSDPEGCEEYVFLGWWTEELGSDNKTAKTWITDFTATQNQTYYAVYKHTEESGVSATTETYGFEDADDATNWTISEAIAKHTDAKATGTYGGKINTNNTYITYNNKVAVTNFSFKFARTSTNSNYNVYIETSTDNSTWTAAETYPMSDFSNGSFTAKSKDFDGATELYVRFHCYNTTAVRYVDDISISYGGGGTTYYTTHPECRDCAVPTINFTNATVNMFDGDAPFRITPVIDGNTMGATVSYTSSNPTKAEVSDDGTVTIHDAMSNEPITITATLGKMSTEEKCQKSVKASYTLNIYNKVTWLVNGSEYTTGNPTTQTTEGGTIDNVPTEPDGSTMCNGKSFVGWTTAEYEEDDAKPEILFASSELSGKHITESVTYHAVFAELTGTLNQYVKGTTDKLNIYDKVMIVNTASNKALKTDKSAVSVTPVEGKITTTDESIIWDVVPVEEGGYYLMYGESFLNASSSNLYVDKDKDAWKTSGTQPYVLNSGRADGMSLKYNSGSFTAAATSTGDAFNMDLYFPGWTIGAYATTCGLCMPKPEVTSTIIKSDRVTITWKAVTNATGYEFICSGGSVTISGTTATITGLTSMADYTYELRAQGGAPYECFRTTRGAFTTTDCDDSPYDITITPYNVVQAIVRWKSEAEKATVKLYSDAACTNVLQTITDATSPCTISGLEENTRYYVKVFGGASQDCESTVQTFLTQTTAVELVEWKNDGVIILLTGDENTASVLIEGKQEKQDVETNIANDLFFSKYYEASGNVKLWAVYNGTAAKISLEKVKVQVSSNGAQWGYVNGNPNANATTSLASFGHKETGYIYPGEEIIVYNGGNNATDGKVIECMAGAYGSGYKNNPDSVWYEVKNNTTSFSGDDGLLLLNDNDTLDVIGGLDYAAAYDSASTSPGWGDGYGWNCDDGTDVAGKPMKLSTNRCILVRKNTVKDGTNAVAKNKTDFVTLCEEWWGSSVPKNDDSQAEIQSSCDNFSYVGHYDYQDYYASFEPVDTIETLTKNDDGTITIPIPKLDTMSCSMLRINVYDKTTQEQKASREYRIPIMIQSGEVKSTNELFTKHGVAVCKECDVLVFNGATLKKDNEGTDRDSIGNLTLYPGSTLELPDGKGDYHVKSLTYRVEGDNVPVTKLSADDHLYTETQRLVVTRRIKNDRYYFISFPYDVNVNEITLANGNQAVNGKDFRLMEYDAEARAAEGSLQGAPGHWKLFSGDKLTAGQGYAIAVNTKAMKEILFPMTLPSSNLTNEEHSKTTNTVDINEYVGDARNTNHNWNLIAHPYITKFEVTGATSVEAYWENPSRQDSAWVDDWKTWPEEDPTQPTDTTHAQNPDSTGTQTDYIDRGTLNDGCIWVLYNDGTMELSGSGQVGEFSTQDDVPWKTHREKITSVKVIGEIQLINRYAFAQCTNLTNVTIAAPVSQINAQAFAACNQLTTIRIESSLSSPITADGEVFDGVDPSKITLMVPQSLLSAYRNATPWRNMTVKAISGTNTNPTPRRVAEHPEGWTESAGGIYVTVPIVVDGKVDYEQHWINDVDDIKPFTAVFIQGDGRGQMTFNMYPATPAPKRMWQADRYETRDHTVFVGLTIHGNGHKDMTSLRLRPDFTEEYKLNLDLLKFTTFYTSRPQIYFKTENDQLAYRAVSDSLAANTWLPVGVYCRDAGEYTFALYDRYVWDEVEAVYLRDNVTGAETNLLMGNYTITTTGQIYTNTRFAVKVLLRRKVKDTPTMIDHTEDPNAPRKFFRDGLLYILRDGKVYDLTGKPVQFDDLLNR